ncbi:MAG: hypothetical protein A3F16_07980 [Deltaproteobacteria bacterium RIFCSPHIGHO2_12_FULL_43_9]|nr:MAG: hypothetical protein A3F16_07980 [Deltaproteobacteria bacterium RIFCSPHIGHO2_12_FULL_43_9]
MEKSSYKTTLKKSAFKELESVPRAYIKNIIRTIEELSEEPRPRGCEKLIGKELYRVRIGKYRVIYSIDDENQIIGIIKIGHRKDIYR